MRYEKGTDRKKYKFNPVFVETFVRRETSGHFRCQKGYDGV